MRSLRTPELPIAEIPPFGNIDLGIPVHRLFLLGFRPGDAVDVEFSNGFAFRNIPLFSGFYGTGHLPCLYAADKFYPNAGIGCPVSGNPWTMAGVHAGDSAHIRLHRRRGYSILESRMRLPRMLAPDRTRSREQNANWRAVATGKIPFGVLYRSSSPIRIDSPAAATACELMQETGIRSVLNLSDKPALCQARRKDGNAHIEPYVHLCENGCVLPLHLGVDYQMQENARTLARGLLWLTEQPKPALIHCNLGLDRTGMVCVLLEMLAGASYADIEHDYQLSYLNLFGPPPDCTGSYPLCDLRLTELVDFLLSLAEADDGAPRADDGRRNAPGKPRQYPSSETLRRAARAYLAFGGLNEGQIAQVGRMLAEVSRTSEGSLQ